jgi:hypothetical protein
VVHPGQRPGPGRRENRQLRCWRALYGQRDLEWQIIWSAVITLMAVAEGGRLTLASELAFRLIWPSNIHRKLVSCFRYGPPGNRTIRDAAVRPHGGNYATCVGLFSPDWRYLMVEVDPASIPGPASCS